MAVNFRFAVFAPTVPEIRRQAKRIAVLPPGWTVDAGPFNVASRHQPTGAFKN
jgi:hypothetical protein